MKLSSARLPRGLLLQAADRLGAARALPRGPDRHDRLPRRGGPAGAAAGRLRGGEAPRRPAPGHLRARQPVRRAAGPRPRRSSARPTRSCSRSPAAIGAPLLATNDSHYTSREDAVAHDALLCVQTGLDDGRPEALQVRGQRALPEVARRRCASCSASFPRPATTRCGSPSGPTSRSSSASRSSRRSPAPRGSPTPTPTCATSTYEGGRGATATPLPAKVADRLEYELGVISQHGLLGLLPRRLGPHPPRPGERDPGGPGPGQRGGLLRRLLPAHRGPRPDPLRPAVRAVPQPRPQADARHRHGLRRALPRAR